MKIVLVLISTIAVSSSAILFPHEMDQYKVTYQTNRLGIVKDPTSKVLSKLMKSSHEEYHLEPRNMIKIEDFAIDSALRMNNGYKVPIIKPFQKQTINKQDKAQPEKLNKTYNFYAKKIYQNRNKNHERNESLESKIKPFQKETIIKQDKAKPENSNKTYNFYAKRIYKNRNKNNEKNESLESNLRSLVIASPVKLAKKTKYLTEENQDRSEFIFMKNKNYKANGSKNRRRKRSSNIIVEENLFTTVSALKYTGHDTRLTNNLYFKNINQ